MVPRLTLSVAIVDRLLPFHRTMVCGVRCRSLDFFQGDRGNQSTPMPLGE